MLVISIHWNPHVIFLLRLLLLLVVLMVVVAILHTWNMLRARLSLPSISQLQDEINHS